MKHLLWICLLYFSGFHLHAQQSVRGTVYDDANSNGKKDRRERGLEGVAVSNGVDVVVTDKNGQYTLSVGTDNIIFVIKPSGYTVPVNAMQQPQFYHIHKPSGSPANQRYAGVQPTGELPKSVDFALRPSDDESSFSAIVFGDPQPYTRQEVDFFDRGIVRELKGVKGYRFGISLGDIVGDDLSLHQPYIESVSGIGIPWYNVLGNHDLNYEATADSLSDETFERNFGPANYSYNYGQAHFLILDDVLYPDPRDNKGYYGGFRPDQMAFIRNNLALVPKDRLVVLAFHIPLNNPESNFRPDDRRELFELLKDFQNVLIMSAHTHLQRNDLFTSEDGWQGRRPLHEYNAGTTSGDWYSGLPDSNNVPVSVMRDGTPKGYAFLNINGTDYTIDYKVAGSLLSRQMDIHGPKIIQARRRTSARFYVNFYMGRADSDVQMRISEGPWQKMNFLSAADPLYTGKLFEWDTSDTLRPYRRPSVPVNSTHLWWSPVPATLDVGDYKVEIRAVDLFGRSFSGFHELKVR